MVQLPVKHSAKHQGKTLQLDSTAETLAVIGQADEHLGTIPWDAIIDFVSGGQYSDLRDLLESIVFPSASFVRGYEPFTAVTRGGDDFTDDIPF